MYGRRRVGPAAGRVLTFGASEWLENNAQVLFDHQTNSLWSHATGRCLAGPFRGQRLERLPGAMVVPRIAWAAWRDLFPHSLVLSVAGRENAAFDRYADYRNDPVRAGLYVPQRRDRRAPPKMLVVGVAVEHGAAAAAAYPLDVLRGRPLVADRVGGVPVLVVFNARSGATAVWRRPAARGDFSLTPNSVLVGPGGKRWHALTGRRLDAGAAGTDLSPVAHTRAYWFAWAAFHPRTTLVGF